MVILIKKKSVKEANFKMLESKLFWLTFLTPQHPQKTSTVNLIRLTDVVKNWRCLFWEQIRNLYMKYLLIK